MSAAGADRPVKASKKRRAAKAKVPADVVGWRERVDLPELGLSEVKAKIDTGARSSSLHADDISIHERRGVAWVRFIYRAAPDARGRYLDVPLLDMRWVKSSNGQREHRPAIQTLIHLGSHRWRCEVTLSARWNMGFPMLLGREALRRRFLIHPGRSFLLSHKDVQGKA